MGSDSNRVVVSGRHSDWSKQYLLSKKSDIALARSVEQDPGISWFSIFSSLLEKGTVLICTQPNANGPSRM